MLYSLEVLDRVTKEIEFANQVKREFLANIEVGKDDVDEEVYKNALEFVCRNYLHKLKFAVNMLEFYVGGEANENT